MNLTALKHYLATQFHTNIRIYDRKRHLLHLYTKRIDLDDAFYEGNIENTILDTASEDAPLIISIGSGMAYGTVVTGSSVYVIGPVHLTDCMELRFEVPNATCPSDNVCQVSPCTLADFLNSLLLLYNLFHEDLLSIQSAMNTNNITNQLEEDIHSRHSALLFNNREYSNHHNPYDQEQRELLSIETGNLEQLKQSWEEEYSGSYGVISKDAIRNGKYLAIIVVAMATRAAIRGGLLPEVAMSMGDSYMQQIDETHNPYDLGNITKTAEYTLAQMVAENKPHLLSSDTLPENPTIERCKDYIFTHLHDKLTVKEIADHLHMHPNYLSSSFKAYEGVSLYQYILNEKISLVKNFLIYSDYSFSEIATYLGFSSQSHLGKVFKKAAGMTPQQFKNKYHKV